MAFSILACKKRVDDRLAQSPASVSEKLLGVSSIPVVSLGAASIRFLASSNRALRLEYFRLFHGVAVLGARLQASNAARRSVTGIR